MIVCFAGARRLGLDCLKWLTEQDDVKVAGAWVPDRGWWTDCRDRDELLMLRVPLTPLSHFRYLWDAVGEAPDLVVSVLTDYIFQQRDLSAYDAVNLHPAPLPRYRGCNSYAHAIQNGDSRYAVTLHYIDEGIDTGPIVHQAWFPIRANDTGRSLYDRAQEHAFRAFTTAMPAVLAAHREGHRTHAREQAGPVGYYPRSSLTDKRTHPEDEQRIRALTFPPHPAPEITVAVPVGHGR